MLSYISLPLTNPVTGVIEYKRVPFTNENGNMKQSIEKANIDFLVNQIENLEIPKVHKNLNE